MSKILSLAAKCDFLLKRITLRTSLHTQSLSLRSQSRIRHASSTSSIDPSEVSNFNALASTWWDVNGPSRLLHLMNPLRHDFIASCHNLEPNPSPKRDLHYLDVGCGGGIFTESAARLAHTAKVVGIDPSGAAVEAAKTHARQDPKLQEPGRLEYLNQPIESLSLPDALDEAYDVVSLFEVIEHSSAPADFLRTCLHFVKPGGWLVLSTIARTWTSWMTTKVAAEDIIRLVPKGMHDWAKYINEKELRDFFDSQKGWGRDGVIATGCLYIPGLGWRMVSGGEQWGNYFFGIRRDS
ncbi:MAG: hypothetical protein Q9214_000466 [Letrouitia sp. 1 TL-2023]